MRTICFGLLLAFASSGCAYFRANTPLKPVAHKARVASDVPVPAGFVLDKGRSFQHKRASFRKLKLVYRRTEYLSEKRVRAFLQEAFPKAGWELAFIYGLDETRMIFTKGPEECLVRVKEDFRDRYTQLDVRVQRRKAAGGQAVAHRPVAKPRKARKRLK